MGGGLGSRHLGAGVLTRARLGYGISLDAGVANGKTCDGVVGYRVAMSSPANQAAA